MIRPNKLLIGTFLASVVIASGAFTYINKKNTCEQPQAKTKPVSETNNVGYRKEENDDTNPTEETVRKKYVRITSSTGLREKLSYSSERIVTLETDAECLLLDESDDSYKIRCGDGKKGWILKDYGKPFEKDVVVKHIPKKPSGTPFSMADTAEGENLGNILNENGTVGASVAIIKDGKVAYHYEYGYANKEDLDHPVPIQENTKYRVASVSKVFTAMLAMAEVDDGMLDLDANLSDLFGFGFYNPKYPHTPLTMRMLLTHTAGLSNKEGLYHEDLSSVAHGQEYYLALPGNKYCYSNLGLGIAGAAVEKASGKTISQYARERFFEPMGIDASYDGSLLSDPSLVADCYNNGKHKRSNKVLTKPVGNKKTQPGEIYYLGQGNLLISAIDLAKVSTILLNDGMYDSRQYLRSDTVKNMLSVHPIDTKADYNQCIGIRKSADLVHQRDIYYHNGNYYGILSLMAIDPSDKSGVIIITSGAHPTRENNTVFKVCNDVMRYCYNDII